MNSPIERSRGFRISIMTMWIAVGLLHGAQAQYIYSDKYLISFRSVSSSAQSFVMGGEYSIQVKWQVEGKSPDRDFVMKYRLVDSYGRRVVAAADVAPRPPTSAWQPGRTYTQKVVLQVSPEDPTDAKSNPSSPAVKEETHRLVVSVRDPQTGGSLILSNKVGDQPDHVGTTYQLGSFYVSKQPIEITILSPAEGTVLKPNPITVSVTNVSDRDLSADLLLTVRTETDRIVSQHVRIIRIPSHGSTETYFEWTPHVAGKMFVELRVERQGVMLTEAVRGVTVSPPLGQRLRVVKFNSVKRDGDRFCTPLTVTADGLSDQTIKVAVFADGRSVGGNEASGGTVEVPAEPWFGYYDVVVDAGHYEYHKRLVATVCETNGMDILVNGEPFIVKGVNVHAFDSGSRENTRIMMRILTELGFNTFRGDYPPLWQIDMGYEMNAGWLVLAPYSVTSTEEVFERCDGPPLVTTREVTRRFVERYRDSAGTLFWNSCNEIVGETPDFLISQYGVIKTFDPYERPVLYANLFGQDFHQGQDFMGVNYYFGQNQRAKDRQPMVLRSIDIARKYSLPVVYTEYNAWWGNVHSTGAEAVRDLFEFGLEHGMSGGYFYQKYDDSTRHPGVFDSSYNTYKILNDALRKAFADADVSLVETEGETARIRLSNKRRFTLRDVVLEPIVGGRKIEPIEVADIPPLGSSTVEIPLTRDARTQGCAIDGTLRFVTHHGFRSTLPVHVLVPE